MRRGHPLPKSSRSTPTCSSSWPTRQCTPTRRVARRLGRRYAELTPIVNSSNELASARGDLEAALELAAEDPSFAAEADLIAQRVADLETELGELLIPAGPERRKDVILEVKAGEGGEESALFAGDLLRMYLRYAERRGWVTEVLDAQESDLGGFKDVTVAIKTKGLPAAGRGLVAAEVRGRRAPGPAGTGDRVAGPHPHLGGRRAGRPGGRGRPTSRSTPTICGSTCSGRPARVASRSTPPTPRCGSPTCRPASW